MAYSLLDSEAPLLDRCVRLLTNLSPRWSVCEHGRALLPSPTRRREHPPGRRGQERDSVQRRHDHQEEAIAGDQREVLDCSAEHCPEEVGPEGDGGGAHTAEALGEDQ